MHVLRKRFSVAILFVMLFLLSLVMPSSADDFAITVHLDKTSVKLNDTINISYSISGFKSGMELDARVNIYNREKNLQSSYASDMILYEKIYSRSGNLQYRVKNDQGDYITLELSVYNPNGKWATYKSPEIPIINGKRRQTQYFYSWTLSKKTVRVGETVYGYCSGNNESNVEDIIGCGWRVDRADGMIVDSDERERGLPAEFTTSQPGKYRFVMHVGAGEPNDSLIWSYNFYSEYFEVVSTDGSNPAPSSDSGWRKIENEWYYYSQGTIKTGWINDGGKWYYCIPGLGRMVHGQFAFIDGKWYYFNDSGQMQTGWQWINGKWYYMDNTGARQTGSQWINGKYYYFDNGGVMQTGWHHEDTQKFSGWKYFFDDGSKAYYWTNVGGKWYYFLPPAGYMATGWLWIDRSDDHHHSTLKAYNNNGDWYYFDESGVYVTGWKQINGVWYYFKANGAMVTGTQIINGKRYQFSSSGAWIN